MARDLSAAAAAPTPAVCGYAPLLTDTAAAIQQATAVLSPTLLADGGPRAGLGGALLLLSAWTLGRRRWREAEYAAVLALEAYNHHAVSQELPDAHAPPDWLQAPLLRLRRYGVARFTRERALISRVIAGTTPRTADVPSPEPVLFLRAAVAGATLVGDIPEAEQRALDTVAQWWGLALAPELSLAQWQGAGGIGPPSREVARQAALSALSALPHSRLTEALHDSIQATVPESVVRAGWEPLRILPALAPAPPDPSPAEVGGLAGFQRAWGPAVEDALAALVSSPSEVVTEALAHLRGQGGKRLRPLLALAAAKAVGGDPAAALPVGAAAEWIHQSSLLLDDILDRGETRRGLPTLHTVGSVPFAVGVAGWILACLHEAPLPAGGRQALLASGIELLWGQHRELCHTGDPDTDLRIYGQVIQAKTAALFAAAAEGGAHSVGAPGRHCRALRTFGLEIGQAFQIIDDLLDYEGETERLGKPAGADLRARKVTLPVLLLLEVLPPPERARLRAAVAAGDGAALPWVRAQLAAHGIPARCRAAAAAHQQRAVAALGRLPDAEGVALLSALAGRMVERQR